MARAFYGVAIAWLACATPAAAQSDSDLFMRAHALAGRGNWQDARDRLEEASGLYLWGFSTPDLEADREQVMLEARRIMPLLTPRDSARWRLLLEGDVDAIDLVSGASRSRATEIEIEIIG